jgi:hypothetical protein
MNILVVNCSAPHYNLGTAKLVNWFRDRGHSVDMDVIEKRARRSKSARYPKKLHGYDLVCLSVIFSPDAPDAARVARIVKAHSDVWCGGPGIWALGRQGWWKRETGLDCVVGIDPTFDQQKGNYLFTRASLGCDEACWFCNVPTFEGKEFTLLPDFQLAPILTDNNLSALPVEYQRHIIERYEKGGVPLVDANSGFAPRHFDADTYHRWKPLLDRTRAPWRFALDEMIELPEAGAVLDLLKDEPSYRKRVYVLIGNEPVRACYERLRFVIDRGGEPHCQYVWPLNYLGGPLWEKYDWTEQLGIDFCRYVNLHLWRNTEIWDYRPRVAGKAPFWFLRSTRMMV